ncbi:unnamed protein product [Amoebophrya sp. A120]|nr:unnamed protein product [Amoebophrya sp. A120]|eukprot:GSA120T00015994001.1
MLVGLKLRRSFFSARDKQTILNLKIHHAHPIELFLKDGTKTSRCAADLFQKNKSHGIGFSENKFISRTVRKRLPLREILHSLLRPAQISSTIKKEVQRHLFLINFFFATSRVSARPDSRSWRSPRAKGSRRWSN